MASVITRSNLLKEIINPKVGQKVNFSNEKKKCKNSNKYFYIIGEMKKKLFVHHLSTVKVMMQGKREKEI